MSRGWKKRKQTLMGFDPFQNFEIGGSRKVDKFEIIGKKIPLLERRIPEARRNNFNSDINMEILRFKANSNLDLRISELRRKMDMTYAYSKDSEAENVASKGLVEQVGGISKEDVPKKSAYRIESKRKGMLTKKRPEIKISLPPICMKKMEDTEDDYDEEGIFNEKMYMVCQQSPAGGTHWNTTCVNFPKDTWKLERRRLSHRHSSLGSSISLSFARLDLACRTPEHGMLSTPITDNNFVFPSSKED